MRLLIAIENLYNFPVMRSSLVVRASDCQCTSCNGPGFDPSIRRHSGIWGAAVEAVLNIVWKRIKNPPKKYLKKKKISYDNLGTTNFFSHFSRDQQCLEMLCPYLEEIRWYRNCVWIFLRIHTLETLFWYRYIFYQRLMVIRIAYGR